MSLRLTSITCLAVCLLVAGLLALPALAQAPDATISMSVDSITETDAGFVVTGTVTTAGPVTEAHVNRYYTAHVLAEIMETDSAQYPGLPEAVRMTTPDGAETAFVTGSGPGGTMTNEELHGVDITTVTLGSSGGPGTFEFSGTIPLAHAGKPFRIRAWLDYQVMYSGAMNPGITYKHAEGFSGTVSGIASTSTPDNVSNVDAEDSDDAGDADDRTDPDPPFNISGDFNMDVPEGRITDDLLGHGGDLYTTPLTGAGNDEITGHSLEELRDIITNINASLAAGNLTAEQRAELTETRNDLAPAYHQALVNQAVNEQAKIWADFAATMVAHAVDKILTYHPHIGPVWSTAKAIVLAEKGEWFDTVLNASTVPPSIPVGGGKWVTNLSQLTQDFVFIGNAVMPAGTYGNWKTGAAGPPSPTWGGENP